MNEPRYYVLTNGLKVRVEVDVLYVVFPGKDDEVRVTWERDTEVLAEILRIELANRGKRR
jgi:hypothetical protein